MSNYLVTYLPTDPPTHHTYLPPYFLTYLPTYSLFSSLSCFLRSRAAAHIVQQNVDARARRSLNKTFLYKDERRSLNKTLTRRHAARSTRLDDVDLDDPRLDWRWPCDL